MFPYVVECDSCNCTVLFAKVVILIMIMLMLVMMMLSQCSYHTDAYGRINGEWRIAEDEPARTLVHQK